MSHESNREKLINVLGEQRFLGVYSAVALATLIPTTWIYGMYHFKRVGTMRCVLIRSLKFQ